MTEVMENRRADWFGLFFDLVFVVTVAVLAYELHGDPGWRDFGTFAFLAMPGLGLMAAAAPEGLGSRAWAYSLGVAWVCVVIFALWWPQAGDNRWGIPGWRPVLYALLPAVIWVAAVSARVSSLS